MPTTRVWLTVLSWLAVSAWSQDSTAPAAQDRVIWSGVTNQSRVCTNGPAIFRVSTTELLHISTNPQLARNQQLLRSTNELPARVRERLLKANEPPFLTNVIQVTNLVFHSFLPTSLHHLAWTNLLARTNGRSMQVWSTRSHPPGWPRSARVAAEWNRQSLIFGLTGFTALSPCWEGEGESGQAPITALTRRHGYTRGHGMGAEGFRRSLAGKKVWFLAQDNKLVQVRVLRELVRSRDGRDYTLLLFDEDLPGSVKPLRVVDRQQLWATYTNVANAPIAMVFMEQHGHAATSLPEMTYSVYKGGDSGSANLLMLPGELIFVAGRSTSAPDTLMQADMDELCRLEKLNPAPYQMSWLDLSAFPKF